MSGPRFRFRAQPALDLRRREDEEAQGAVARAQAALSEAQQAADAAGRRAHEARLACGAVMAQAGSHAEQTWHRTWIVRLDGERQACLAAVAARAAEVARATAARLRTHRRVKALERLKEKMARRWAEETAAGERRHLDALATVRFVARREDAGTRTNG